MRAAWRTLVTMTVLVVVWAAAASAARADGWGNPDYSPDDKCFHVAADWMFLRRDHGEHTFLAEQIDARTGRTLRELNSGDIDVFRFASGLQVMMGWHLGDGLLLEVSYFGEHEWTAHGTLTNFGQLGDVALTSPYLFIQGINVPRYDFTYETELHSVDVSLRYLLTSSDCSAWSTTAGFRYIQVGESANLRGRSFTAAGALVVNESSQVSTENNLLGFNFGSELFLGGEHLGMSIFGKGGIYANAADAHITNRFEPADGLQRTRLNVGMGEVLPAASLEGGVQFCLRVSDHLTFRGGYQVLFLAGLAEAPEQFTSNRELFRRTIKTDNTSIFPTAQGRLNRDGFEVYHGATVGVELSW